MWEGKTMNLKNVVVVCDYAYFEGGAANVAMKTAIALAEYTELNVYCFAGCGEPCKELKASRVKVIALHLPDLLGNKNKLDAFCKGIYNQKVELQMMKLLSGLNPEETVVHIHTWTKVLTSAVFRGVERAGFPLFLTVHDYFLACPNGACYNYVSKKICELRPFSRSCILCNCDARSYPQKIWRCVRQKRQNDVIRKNDDIHYIFISDYEKRQLLTRIPNIKHQHLLKNPINVSERMRIDVSSNDYFFYIGRLSGEKGPELFCEAVTKAKIKGVIIGDGLLSDMLKAKYPNIKFTGWLNKQQINQRLKKARALIFPTLWYEGSPLTVPEVQAHGIPCIVTDCSSAIDDIIDGQNGEIVEPDVDKMVAAIKRFLDDEYIKKLSEVTYETFDKLRVSDEHYVKELLKIYDLR